MAVLLMPLRYTYATLVFLLLTVGDCLHMEPNLCDSACAGSPPSELPYEQGVSYTYRYSTAVATTLHGSGAGRNGLALDCVVDIEVVSQCHLTMQIRNAQIKRLSPQREHSVLSLKTLRESLERTRLKFSLRGGKVTALCHQEGEQVWALNIKRALLSMLQTSPVVTKVKEERETDIHGTCSSRYERRGAAILKTRDLKRCQQSRLDSFWPHSVALTEDTSVHMELQCVQRHGASVMEEVNCTEAVSVESWSGTPGLVKTRTMSTLVLLRAQPATPSAAESPRTDVLTDLQFEDEETSWLRRTRSSTPEKAGQTVRLLCSLTSDPQLASQEFLQLVFQLKDLTLPQLRTLWQEASFKCRSDWQPLLEALTACGSENCIVLLTELMRDREVEEGEARSFLTTIALTPHPSAQIIGSVTALVDDPELRFKALLAGSSLAYQLCQRTQTSCRELPQVQTFMQRLEKSLNVGCEGDQPSRVRELFYVLKSVGNAGLSASVFVPLLNNCILGRETRLELKHAAIQAFRRFPCSADRTVLLQLYSSSQEDPEVRIAAYQQLMLCPEQQVFHVVKATLHSDASSQVGSFVWSHLTNVLRSEDPLKQALIQLLPDDIISKEFEKDFLKYSSYSEHTFSSGIGLKNVETSLIFSPKSFLPRSASANLTVYFHGRAHNPLEVEVHLENFEPLVKSMFGHLRENEPLHELRKDQAGTSRRKTDDGHRGGKERCSSSTSAYLERARVMLFGRQNLEEKRPKCWVGVKVFGNELSVFTCDDIRHRVHQVSLHMAGLAVKLLKGHEVQLSHRAVPLTEKLVLPSLSGLPITLSINMTSVFSLRLKANVDYRDASHFFLNGFVKPKAYVGLSARMGVLSTLGQAAVEWVAELRSSTSLDGSFQLQEGRDVRITLNTPEDLMDIISLSSRVFQLSGDYREEIKGPKSRVQKTTCTPKTWSKMIGWQLCSNTSHPSAVSSYTLPPPGPVHLSLSLLKLDRGLRYYLLEAAYSLHHQRGAWLPSDASIHLLLATPASSVPRDTSLDLAFSPHRVLLRIIHPLKTILIQGQLEQERNVRSGKLELVIDGSRYYIMGLVDTHSFLSEWRTRYHLEAKMAADENPMILSANVTRGLGQKSSFSATVKNVFRETASVSVALERRKDASSRQYSLEAELLLPGLVGGRMLGLMEQRRSMWSSMLRLKYGLGGNARHLRQECYTTQRLRSERGSNSTSIMRADHEFYCISTDPINHKVHLRHEESSSHVKSVLDVSYGKHWDEINNKRTLLLSQSFKNQSIHNDTSYILEFNLQVPEKNLNYRTQLMHSQQTRLGSESSTHLKINYNDLMPLVAGLHWKSSVKDPLQKKWEGSFNVDTPWLHVYTAHKLSWLHHHTLQLTSELTASKFLPAGNLILEGWYRPRGRGKEARLALFSAAATFLQAEVWGVVGKRAVEASGQLSSLWTLPLRGNISLETSRISQVLQMNTTYGEKNVSVAAALSTAGQSLKKSQVFLKMSFTKPKSPATEVELEGVVEELRKDKRTYQKTAALQLRQPLQTFPQALLLQETFTVDLLKNLYVLETKAGLHGNREVIHTLTLGYKSPNPFVCSALLHPFSSETFPSNSEICVTVSSNQTHKEVGLRVRVESSERLTFFGQLHMSPLHSNVKVVFSHHLQLQLPSSAGLEGDACWIPKDSSNFDYQARGKLRIERHECRFGIQLTGTSGSVGLHSSLSHPFKSKIPKTLEVKAAAASGVGRGSSSVHVSADGKDRLMLNAQMFHFFKNADGAAGLELNLSQSLLPSASKLHVNVGANVTVDSVLLRGSFTQGQEALLVRVKGSLKQSKGLRLAVSGDLRHSVSSFSALPPVLGLDGTWGQSNHLIKGQLRVRVMETVHSLELRHHRNAARSRNTNDENGAMGEKVEGARDWLCVWSGTEHLCVNVSRKLANQERGEVFLQACHSFRWLSVTGVPANTSARVKWASDGGGLSASAELQSGPEHLKTEFQGGRTDHPTPRWRYSCRLQQRVKALQERGLTSSFQAEVQYQLEAGRLDAGLILYAADVKTAEIIFNFVSKNKTAILAVSLWQQGKQLQGLMPSSLQMNCTGDATVDQLSAHCSGNVADRPVETLLPPQASVNVSVTHSSCSTDLRSVLQTDGEPKATLSLSLRVRPRLSLTASVWHSLEPIKALHFPTKGELLLSFWRWPGVAFSLELGLCSFRANLGKTVGPETDPGPSSYTADVTSNCPSLQGSTLPASLALQGLLSVSPCQLNVSSSVRLDTQTFSLDLRQSCRTPHLYGSLTHSFPQLRGQGLPQTITVEAAVPEGPEQAGVLFIRVGRCDIRARSVADTRGTARQLWVLESTCPFLQVHVNGSVRQDLHGVWTVVLNSDMGGRRALLQLHAKPWPELSVEGQLSHDLPALGGLPTSSRLRISARAGKLRHDGDLLVQMEECVVRAEGGVMLQPGLQGSLVYHNNCTATQGWGGPRRMQASGSLAVFADLVDSQINVAVDDANLHALLAFRKTKDESEASVSVDHSVPLLKKLALPATAAFTLNSGSRTNRSYFFTFNSSVGNQTLSQEMAVAKTSETVKVKSDFRHTVNYLKKLGVPANNHIQLELGSSEEKALTLQTRCGDQQAGLTLHVKSFPLNKEIRGTMWHSWPWLHDIELPPVIEGLCSIQGTSALLHFKTQLSVAGQKLLTSGLNMSVADGHLAALLSYSPPELNQTKRQHKLDTVLTAQFRGPLRGVSLDVCCQDWQVRVMGDVGGWGTHGGTKEAKVTLKHTTQGKKSPVLQVKAWGRLTESQLRCSMAVNPELSSSLALIVQGHHLPHNKDLMLKVAHNIPDLTVYLPPQLSLRSQLNQSQSGVAGVVEVLSGRRTLWALGELAAIQGGYRQSVEVKHSCPQLKPLPRFIAVKTVYESRRWSYHLQQAAVWGSHEFSLSGLYSDPPALEMDNQTLRVQLRTVPRLTSLEVTLERSLHGGLDSVLLGWTRHGQLEQARALRAWTHSEDRNETTLDLQQPFSTLRKLSLQTVSHSSQRDKHINHQAHLSLEGAVPVNISVSLNTQWQGNSSRGQVCMLLAAPQMVASSVHGCVSAAQEGNSYSQNAELRWGRQSVNQGVKYQKTLRGMHSLQVHVGLDGVSPAPCPSHTLLAKVQTNLRDRLEHTVLLDICPLQPALSWSGSHRVKLGEELFYSRSRLTVTGRPHECSFTLVLTNSSTARGLNMSLFSESRVGNWSLEVGGSALSWPGGWSLQTETTMDHREKILLNGTLEGRCLQTMAGYVNGPGLSEDLTAAMCVGSNHTFMMTVQRGDDTLGSVSLGTANQRLMLRASGCLEALTAAERRVQYLSARIENKLLKRIKTLQHFVADFREQSRDSRLLQELSVVPLHILKWAEVLLEQENRGLMEQENRGLMKQENRGSMEQENRGLLALWHRSLLRHMLTNSLPRFLSLLQHASLLAQQELRRPLATLAGVYQDVKGQKLDVMWREAVLMGTDRLVDVLATLLENPHLKQFSQAGAAALKAALDMAGQHTYHWTETRLAAALSGIRKQLASLYKFSPRECEVTVAVFLPRLSSSKLAEAGLMETLLEEWLLGPLQALTSVRPRAEFYRLKRKLMDSPFTHQALVVADQFVVTFDGRLYELPGSCPLLLARDVAPDPSFTLLLGADSESFLLVHMNNRTVDIQRNGDVKMDCSGAATFTFHSDDGLTVRRGSNVVQVSNQDGGSVSCDLSLELCSFTLDGWSHGVSTGLLGTNDNDAFNDLPLPDGSQAEALEDFFHSWLLRPKCSRPPDAEDLTSAAAMSPVSCRSLFSSPDSLLSSCFRVVDPGQFLSVCESASSKAPCRLASAFVHLCKQNYIPLEVPALCMKA